MNDKIDGGTIVDEWLCGGEDKGFIPHGFNNIYSRGFAVWNLSATPIFYQCGGRA
jgi:hypothetical protein